MFQFHAPTAAEIQSALAAGRAGPVTHPHVGATRNGEWPPGYARDARRVELGRGAEVFSRACRALDAWTPFSVDFVALHGGDRAPELGLHVAVVAHTMGLYSINVSRVVYLVDEPTRHGFAYSTTTHHVETGEERFLVEMNPGTGTVHYDLSAFSRPRHVLPWLGYPFTRAMQRRFALGSLDAMRRACA